MQQRHGIVLTQGYPALQKQVQKCLNDKHRLEGHADQEQKQHAVQFQALTSAMKPTSWGELQANTLLFCQIRLASSYDLWVELVKMTPSGGIFLSEACCKS
jgi:hypothetical protein